ncbi:hypothetical protein ABPG74_013843 [Tetrahymena malaccensis]
MIQNSLISQYFSQGGYINFDESYTTSQIKNLSTQIQNSQDLKESKEKIPLQTQDISQFNQTEIKKKPRKQLVYKSNNFITEQIEQKISSTCYQNAAISEDSKEKENQKENQDIYFRQVHQNQCERQTQSHQTQECNSFENQNQDISFLQLIKNQIQQELNVISQFQCIQQLQNFTNNLGLKLNFHKKHVNTCCLNFLSSSISQKIFQDIKNHKQKINSKQSQKRQRGFHNLRNQDKPNKYIEKKETPYTVRLSDTPQDLGDWNSFEIKKQDATASFTDEKENEEEDSSFYDDEFLNTEQNFPSLQVQQNLQMKIQQEQNVSYDILKNDEINIKKNSKIDIRVNNQQQQKSSSSSSSFCSIELAKTDDDDMRLSELHSLSGEKEKLCEENFHQQNLDNFQLNIEQVNNHIKQFDLCEDNQKEKGVSDVCHTNLQPLNMLYKKNILLQKIQKMQQEQKVRQKNDSTQFEEACVEKYNKEASDHDDSKLFTKSDIIDVKFQNSQNIFQSLVQQQQSIKGNHRQITYQKFLQQRSFLRMQLRAIEGIKDLKLGCKVYNNNIYIYEKEEPPFMRGFNIFQCNIINMIVDWCQNESDLQDKFQSKIIVDVSIQDQFKGFFNQILLRPDGYFKQGNLQLLSKFTRRPQFISSDQPCSNIASQKDTFKAMEFTLINLKLVNPREFYEEINQCNKYLQDKTFDFEYIELEYLQRKCQESLNYEFKLNFEKKKMVKQLIGAFNSLAEKTNFIFGISDIDKKRNQEIYYEHLLNSQFNKKNIFNTLDDFINQTLEIIKENFAVSGEDVEIKAWKKQNEIRIQIDEEILVIEFQILKISDKLYPIKMVVPSSSNLIMIKNQKHKLPNQQGNYTYVRQNASVNILIECQKQNLQQQQQLQQEQEQQEISQFYEFKKEFLSKIKK